jgi:hypothetical protein
MTNYKMVLSTFGGVARAKPAAFIEVEDVNYLGT